MLGSREATIRSLGLRRRGPGDSLRGVLDGLFGPARRLGGFVCGPIDAARGGASIARAAQPRTGGVRTAPAVEGRTASVTAEEAKSTALGAKFASVGVKSRGRVEEGSSKFRKVSWKQEDLGRPCLIWKKYFQVGKMARAVLWDCDSLLKKSCLHDFVICSLFRFNFLYLALKLCSIDLKFGILSFTLTMSLPHLG